MRLPVVRWLEGYLRGDIADLLAPSWFMCVGLAGIAALILMLVLGRRRGIAPATVASAVLWCYVAGVAAGIVVPMLIDAVGHLVATGRLRLRWAGMTSFWGYLAGAAAVALVCRRDRVPLGRMADLAVIPLGVALVFARLGCFMAGCDYGQPSALPWAVQFPAGSPAWRDQVRAGLLAADRPASLPVHPTELYEAALGLVIVAIALVAARRLRKDGRLFVVAAASYAIGRLFVETLRGDAGRGVYAGVSSGQIFSLLVLAAIAAGLVLARRRAAILAVAAGALVFAGAGRAEAQPGLQPPAPPDAPPSTPPPPPQMPGEPPPSPPPPIDAFSPAAPPTVDRFSAAPELAERPQFFTGLLLGVATPLNRRGGQVPTLAGPSLSLGYLPGRFGVWLDLDSFASGEATHGTLLISGSFTQRLTPRLVIGGRIGIGETEVNFKDPAFRDVGGPTFRIEAIAEIVLARHWALWVRPLTIDTLTAADLGGPITTYQFRLGVAYRFGSRRNATPAAPPPEPPPPPYPSLDPPAHDPEPAAAAAPTLGAP